ncbi:methylamine utilization protein MauJ [Rhizobium laguerreae]|uniref:methylamine utilization protein MauJ n=1 Tax=Rhizobium laguerreae TaxID=1076926 RepID=UPI001C926D98|nr:methylamine utilization protein MauJ [Rhizobium laguerreae]MBY3345539.1 hypothetical protein [Rhizobium laguerreae]MBY3352184.1 hypothetical protein [Rhizobium laguerreae]MBY3373246.1 hypothetical protein [Rhizobium laguerreae]MBY3428776.1 hypothetical protein [Rhizobium laguerreae]MBY3437423.1 hypothetical protein [Rhizobium laguerreae]
MYAKNLSQILHAALVRPDPFDDTLKRFEHLRGHGLLPRGRENAPIRLNDRQVASAVLGFVPVSPGWAGHVSLCLGGLCAVGGANASFQATATLLDTVAAVLSSDEACNSLVAMTFIIERNNNSDEYYARGVFDQGGKRKTVSYVSKMAISLLTDGAEERYDHDRIRTPSARQLALGRDFFLRLRKEVALSRQLDLPQKTNWTEYENEEKRDAFHKSLGARPNSHFLNLPVDTAVAWPADPTRVEFAGHRFVLFPKTKDNIHSVSIDLTGEHLSAEDARTLLNRFLSILSWCEDQHAVLGDGWSGNPVPVPIRQYGKGGTIAGQWLFSRSLPDDPELLQRLAYYREGLNAREAGLVTFAVLSFFKVFERRAKSDGRSPNPTKIWIRDVFDTVAATLTPEVMKRFEEARNGKLVQKYVFDNCRIATAHASEEFPSDADASLEIRRLHSAADVIHALARHFLKTEYGFSDSYWADGTK